MKQYKWLIVFGVAVALLPLGALGSEYLIHTMVMTLMFAYLAASWNILGGFAGHFALGNGVYIGIGGYVTALLFAGNAISPWISILIGALVAGLISLALSYPCFKLRGSYYVLSTVALLYVFRIFILNEKTIFGYETGASMGLRVPWRGGALNMQFESKLSYYYIIAALLVAVIAYTIHLRRSKSGFYFSAITTNQEAAEALGVNTTAYKLRAQFISAALTAVGGGFYVMFIMFLDPNRILSYDFSIEIMLYAVVGGLGTVWGPVLGAIVLYPVNELLRTSLGTVAPGLSTALYGLVLMLVIFFMPKGVLFWLTGLFGKIKTKRTAQKSRGVI